MSTPDDAIGAVEALTDRLRDHSKAQPEDEWPADRLRLLSDAGVLGWTVPASYGGSEISHLDLIRGYERLASASLTTAFVLTQRNAAIARICLSDDAGLRTRLLPPLCTADRFTTVGISHLTTSGQHLRQPAVRAQSCDGGYRLDGTVPWVTGAGFADHIVTGATLDDGQEILIALPMENTGIVVAEATPLLALNGSKTASVLLDNVRVSAETLLAGPVVAVMKQGRGGGTGSLTTSALALGHAAAAIERLGEEAPVRPDLQQTHTALAEEARSLRQDLHAAADRTTRDTTINAQTIRKRANSLVLRAAQTYLGAAKGAGFAAGHPAERGVREAMFFLVWSCPQPVLNANLREFACLDDATDWSGSS